MSTDINGLPQAELEVLSCVWRLSQATAREVREAMSSYRPMSHGAMVTLLKRLEEKGLIHKTGGKVGKAFVYAATESPEPTYERVVRDLRERIFGGNGVAMMTSLFGNETPTAEEVDQLQSLLDELKQRQDAEGDVS